MKSSIVLKLPSYVETVLYLLNRNGYSAFVVGGCVRDSVMGSEPNDWDVTTSALVSETEEVFKNYKVIPTGKKHGTVTVLIDGNSVEITTMRTDGEYRDGRHPSDVSFISDINLDLSRRDFTINSIAYNHTDGIIDPFDGIRDIEKRIIRCVGNPEKRFSEDALRILRALRFSSSLGFELDYQTGEELNESYALLKNVSSERIRDELIKLICGRNSEDVLINYSQVIFYLIPDLLPEKGFEQNTDYHIYDVWTHTVKTVSACKNDVVLKLAALLHDIGKPLCHSVDQYGISHFKNHSSVGAAIAERVMKSLRFPHYVINSVKEIILLHENFPAEDSSNLKKHLLKMLKNHSPEVVHNTLEFMKFDAEAKNPLYVGALQDRICKAQVELERIVNENELVTLKTLAINGRDLIGYGIRMEQIGEYLDSAVDAVIEEKAQNNRTSLLNYLLFED